MSESNNKQEQVNLIAFAYRWRKALIIVAVASAVVSAVVSFIIQPKYLSSVVMFPANTNSLAKALFSDDPMGKQDILMFGEEEQAEQMLQILHSDEIRSKICDKYNLMNHYEIKPNENYRLTKLVKEFEDNVTFERTEYQSVRIDVLDKSPDTAAFIANDIAAYLDSVKQRMQRERAMESYLILQNSYDTKMDFIGQMKDSLAKLALLGVLNFESQTEMYTELYATAVVQGRSGAARELKSKLDTLAKYGNAQLFLSERVLLETEWLVELRQKLEQSQVDVEKFVPSKFIVNRAYASEKKAYPIRWLLVLVSTISAVFFCMIVIAIMENYNQYIKQ